MSVGGSVGEDVIAVDEALPDVLLVPGGISPVRVTYAPLIGVIGESARITAKELEVYPGDSPPPGYSMGDRGEIRGARERRSAHDVRRAHG